MKYIVKEFNVFTPRNEAWKEFYHKIPNYINTLLPDSTSIDQFFKSIQGLVEDLNESHKKCRPMECKSYKMIDGDVLIVVSIPMGTKKTAVLDVRIVKVSYIWSNEKGGIR